jgi:hypothetical protein
VRTTAEQAEAKRKERQKKLEIYQKVTSKVNAKVSEYDVNNIVENRIIEAC